MEIVFVRHAEKISDLSDPFLTKRGERQAKFLARFLKKSGRFDEFYCSDLMRAKQTSKAVYKKIKLRPIIEKSLNEFSSSMLKIPRAQWSKEEKEHYDELASFLKKISSEPNSNKRILIISHGFTSRVILSYFMKLNLKKLVPFMTGNTSINMIYWNERFKNWRLRYWNYDGHLPERLKNGD